MKPHSLDQILNKLPWEDRQQVLTRLRNDARLRSLDSAGAWVSSPAEEEMVKDEMMRRLEYARWFVDMSGSKEWALELENAIVNDLHWALALVIARKLKEKGLTLGQEAPIVLL